MDDEYAVKRNTPRSPARSSEYHLTATALFSRDRAAGVPVLFKELCCLCDLCQLRKSKGSRQMKKSSTKLFEPGTAVCFSGDNVN